MRRLILPLLVAGGLLVQLSAKAEDEGLVTLKIMTLETATELAQATLNACRDGGYQVAVAVVDRFGTMQVMLRDRFAGPHTPETARRKAWSAVSFRTPTLEMVDVVKPGQPQFGVNFVTGGLFIGGGVPVESAGSIVGAVGVSGAPGGDIDDQCAQAGIEAIADTLERI